MIPFIDLKAQYFSIKTETDKAVFRVLDSGYYVLGPEVEAFETKFAAYCGVNYAIAVNSGTSALHLALLAAGVGPGDEVIVPAMTFVATVAAVRYCGATPVLVDILPDTFNLDPQGLVAAITEKCKAIIPVHLYGQPANMDEIKEAARRHGLVVIEDAAQAHGAKYKGQRVGSIGNLGCFSFYPTKNLGACGEGGMVVTNDSKLAHTLRVLRDWGQEEKNRHDLAGFNYRMDAIQAAILTVKLRHLDNWIEKRRTLAALYDSLLAKAGLSAPIVSPDTQHVYHIYPFLSANRDTLRNSLQGRGVSTGIHYPLPIHLQPAYGELGSAGEFPIAEWLARQELSLPIYPELTEEQVSEVCSAMCDIHSGLSR